MMPDVTDASASDGESDQEFWSRMSELPYDEADRAQLVRQMDTLRADLARVTAHLEESQQERDRLLKKMHDAEQESGALRTNNTELRAEVERLRVIDEAAREFHNFKNADTHRVLNPTCRLCVALARMTKDRDGCEAASLSRFDEVQELGRERDDLRTELARVTEEMDRWTEENEGLRATLNVVGSMRDRQAEEIAALRAELRTCQETLTACLETTT